MVEARVEDSFDCARGHWSFADKMLGVIQRLHGESCEGGKIAIAGRL
jgi:hypothetical protein